MSTPYTWTLIQPPAPTPSADGTTSTASTDTPGSNVLRDWKVDPITLELVIENGDLVFVSGIEAIAQDCHLALGFFLGEWFADQSVGFPWRQQVFVKSPNLDQIKAAVRTCLLGRKGVTAVDSVVLDFDRSSRNLSIKWSARCSLGVIDGNFNRALPVSNL